MISNPGDNQCVFKIDNYEVNMSLTYGCGDKYSVISLLDGFITLFKNKESIAPICIYDKGYYDYFILTHMTECIVISHSDPSLVCWDGSMFELATKFCNDIRSRDIKEWIPTNEAKRAGLCRKICKEKLKELEELLDKYYEQMGCDYEACGDFIDDDGDNNHEQTGSPSDRRGR